MSKTRHGLPGANHVFVARMKAVYGRDASGAMMEAAFDEAMGDPAKAEAIFRLDCGLDGPYRLFPPATVPVPAKGESPMTTKETLLAAKAATAKALDALEAESTEAYDRVSDLERELEHAKDAATDADARLEEARKAHNALEDLLLTF